jgi:type IV pilus assembly protein PilE
LYRGVAASTSGAPAPTGGSAGSALPARLSDNGGMPNPHFLRARTAAGFSLIELLIAMVIAGTLAFIAVPSFMDSIRKGRRAEGIAALAQLLQAQERFRANNPSYASDLSALPGGPPATTANGYYAITLTNVGASTYTAIATAGSGTSQEKDTLCRTLGVTVSQGNLINSSTNSAGATDTNNANKCWPK